MDSGIQIEAVPPEKPRAWRSQPLEESDMAAPSTIKKFTPKKFVDQIGELATVRAWKIRGALGRRGQTCSATVQRRIAIGGGWIFSSGGSVCSSRGKNCGECGWTPGSRSSAAVGTRPDWARSVFARQVGTRWRSGSLGTAAVWAEIVNRDLRVVASRGIEGSEARKRRRKKATPPRDMEWESGRDAGRRRVKFPKRLLPAESHLLPRLEDSSRAERSSAEENRLGRSVRDRNSAARSRGNPDRRLGEIVQNRGRNLMAQAIREANHGRMRQAELASRMRRNPQDSNRGARSRGRQNPAMASLRHDHALLEKQEIGLSRGNATVEKREQGRRGKNRMASLLDLSRRDLRARDSNLLANGLLKRDRLTANRELRERSPGPRKARVRG